jgi:hypothetical protein
MNNDIHSFLASTFVVGIGVTCRIGPVAGQMGLIVKLISGGTLSIVGAPEGFSNNPFAINTLYPIADGEILSLDNRGIIDFYVTGATCKFTILGSRSAGF